MSSPPEAPAGAPHLRLSGLVVFLVLAGLTAVIFKDFARGRVLFYRDIHVLYFSYGAAFKAAVAQHVLPLWDPTRGFGHPLLAVPDAQSLYPTTWLNAVFPPWTTYDIFAFIHLLWGGLGAYVLARRLAPSPPAALAAASVWITSGPLLSLVNVWHHYAGATWMPWVIWAGDRAIVSPRRRSVALWVAFLCGQIFAGSADMCAMTGLVLAVRLSVQVWPMRRSLGLLRPVAAMAAAYALAGIVTAVQWLPTLELTRGTQRWSFTEEFRTYWSLHPGSLLEVILPLELASLPLPAETRSALFEGREAFILSVYLGLPAFALVLAGLLGRGQRGRGLVAVVAAVALLVALGRFTPIYHIVTTAVPALRILRYPVKAVSVLSLAWALLAGMGVEAWRGGTIAPRRALWLRAVFAATSVLAIAAFVSLAAGAGPLGGLVARAPVEPRADKLVFHAGVRLGVTAALSAATCVLMAFFRKGRVAVALAALAALDLLVAHHRLNKTIPVDLVAFRPELFGHIPAHPSPRVYVYDYQAVGQSPRYLGRLFPYAVAPYADWDKDWVLAVALREYLAPPIGSPWGLEYGYDPDMHRLSPAPLFALNVWLRREDVEGTPAWERLLRLGSVTHVVSLHTTGFDALEPVYEFRSLLLEPIRLFRVRDPLPRAYGVSGTRIVDGDEALQTLAEADFDPRSEVVLAEGESLPPRPGFRADVEVSPSPPDARTVTAQLSHPGYVVMTDRYDPGWRVSLDGKPAPLLRANMAFRAVAVPAGRHEIRLVYRPAGLRYGFVMSGVGVALLAALALTRGRRSNGELTRPAASGP